jgi:hypothetical protein
MTWKLYSKAGYIRGRFVDELRDYSRETAKFIGSSKSRYARLGITVGRSGVGENLIFNITL